MENPPRIILPPDAVAKGPTPSPVPPRKGSGDGDGRRGGVLPIVLIGGVALLSVGIVGYAIGQRSSDTAEQSVELGVLDAPTTTTATTDPTTTEAPTTTTAVTTSAPSTTDAAVTTTTAGPTTTVAPPTTTTEESGGDGAQELEGPPIRSTGTVRQAVLADGVLYLRGRVPSEEFGAEIARRAEQVVGPGNVVNQYEIDPSAPPVDSAPLYVADTVLFPSGGVEINPAFFPLLDLGTTLLEVNENVTITVVAHTDSAGSAGLNQRLSQLRADRVRDYWISQGVDGDRISAEGRGELEPIADNGTTEGKQVNRRAEFIVTGILG